MYQNSDSYNIINETRFRILCELYNRYRAAIYTVINNVNKEELADNKIAEIDSILAEIERYPISWNYYKQQKMQFSSEFENLIIFCDDIISNN